MSRLTSLDGISKGDVIPTVRRRVERVDLVRYAGASDDYVHLHWDRPRVQQDGFPDVLIHGWLTFAYMCQTVGAWAGRDIADPSHYAVRYLRPMFPGIVDCCGEVVDTAIVAGQRVVDLSIWAQDEAATITTRGSMRLTARVGG